jgi:HTH-type transcriptional regulator/antitoxin HipB
MPPRQDMFRVYTAGSLGTAIQHYRKQAGLTQAQLAAKTGLPRTYISKLENGRESDQLDRLLRVLRPLGVRLTIQKADW